MSGDLSETWNSESRYLEEKRWSLFTWRSPGRDSSPQGLQQHVQLRAVGWWPCAALTLTDSAPTAWEVPWGLVSLREVGIVIQTRDGVTAGMPSYKVPFLGKNAILELHL